MREHWVETPTIEMFVREAGEGPPLVLLHGWPQHGAMWEPLMGELAADYRVIAPDLRGFGRSEAPHGRYDKHTLMRDVLALLDTLEVEKATVIGHVWGGWIAWLLALEHPERVERFVDIDVPPPWARDSEVSLSALPKQLLFSSYQWIIASPWLGKRLVSSPSWIERFFLGGSRRRDVWAPERVALHTAPLTEPARAEASVHLYRTFLGLELPKLVRGAYTRNRLEVPGLVIMGAESPIAKLLGVPPERENVEVELLDGVGHYVVDEAPDELLARLRQFLPAATAV
jgi:pimeloyl-ACP methyl ester carboxylesterase